MKKLLLLAAFSAAASLPTFAAILPGACPSRGTATLQDYINLGSVGCEIGDKIFANFSYTNASANNPTAANISVDVLLSLSGIYQVLINPVSTAWVDPFSIGITTIVDTNVCATCRIVQIKDQMNSGNSISANGIIPNGSEVTATHDNGVTLKLDGGPSLETQTSPLFAGVTVLNSTLAYNPTGYAAGNANGRGILLSLEQDVIQGTVPEPATFALLGGGLIGFAFLRRKKA